MEKLHIQNCRIFDRILFVLMILGLASLVYGFILDAERGWVNYLINNYYFLSLAIGAGFFIAIQSITQSGWSAAFRRVPEAMMLFIPISAVLFIGLLFGLHHLYHWSHADAVAHDTLMQHKSPYLNMPFFTARMVLFFALWILMVVLIRRASLREDAEGGIGNFTKIERYSRAFIFILAVTFSLSAVDWMMSVNPHWYSTLYALKNFVSAFLHGIAVMILIVLFLYRRGHFPFLNQSHIHDFSRYIFIIGIFYGYFWFSQFMLIWFANIPEETVYYATRWKNGWTPLFIADLVINWAIPFFVLLPVGTSRNKWVLAAVALLLVPGFWLDLYMQTGPELFDRPAIGIPEVGSFVGFAALFVFIVSRFLSRAALVPVHHPYLDESRHHHFESYI